MTEDLLSQLRQYASQRQMRGSVEHSDNLTLGSVIWKAMAEPCDLQGRDQFRVETIKKMRHLGTLPGRPPDPENELYFEQAADHLISLLVGPSDASGCSGIEIQLLEASEQILNGYLNITMALAGFLAKKFMEASKLPASPGYEPLLVSNGYAPEIARGIAHIAVKSGKRRARESKRFRPVAEAIRFLATPDRQKSKIVARARIILDASEETSIVEEIFNEHRESDAEFLGLLQLVARGQLENFDRLVEIASRVTQTLRLSRGPKVSAASASQEFILQEFPKLTKIRRSYAKRGADEPCDPLTRATRLEFGNSSFDSRPAKRRIKRATKRASLLCSSS